MEATEYAVAKTDRSPSTSIWGDCPVNDLIRRPGKGVYFYDDFKDIPLQPTLTTQIAYGRYKAYGTASCTLVGTSTVNSVETGGGGLKATFNADNDGVSLAQAYPTFMLSGNVSDSGKLWFECRIAVSAILTNGVGFFLGLAETEQLTLSATVPFNAASASISNAGSMIGFFKDEDGLGVVNTVRSDRGTSFTNIGASEGAVVANTFTKLGMVYDPRRNSDCITFYQDGTPLSTKLSKTALQAFTHLDANAVGLMWAMIVDSAGTANVHYNQWWRCAQLNPGETWG